MKWYFFFCIRVQSTHPAPSLLRTALWATSGPSRLPPTPAFLYIIKTNSSLRLSFGSLPLIKQERNISIDTVKRRKVSFWGWKRNKVYSYTLCQFVSWLGENPYKKDFSNAAFWWPFSSKSPRHLHGGLGGPLIHFLISYKFLQIFLSDHYNESQQYLLQR